MKYGVEEKFTVVGVDGCTNQRYVGHFYAVDVDDAEDQAYWGKPDLLIAGVFMGHLETIDSRASAMSHKVLSKM